MSLGPIGFAAPWLLIALAALPILWVLLRAVPPAPVRRRFPGVALLLGLKDNESVSDRTPWWLLLLRMLAVAAVIIGLAGPVLNPAQNRQDTSGPLLILLDGSWASASEWPRKENAIETLLNEAMRAGRPTAVVRLTTPEAPMFQTAETWLTRLPGLAPEAWEPAPADTPAMASLIDQLKAVDRGFETVWVSDGLDRPGRAEVLDVVRAKGPVRVLETGQDVVALRPSGFQDGAVRLTAIRTGHDLDAPHVISVQAHGRDPAGTMRVLEAAEVTFAAGQAVADKDLALPAELRARLTHFSIAGERSAGAVSLTDDGLRRREVALIAGRDDREGLELLSPLHYLEKALEPSADLLHGALTDILPANPDVIVLADVATLSDGEEKMLLDWVSQGGLLLRFAGPRLAASEVSRDTEDALMPVRLRAGGRNVGGAMSWGEPKTLAQFDEDSPFSGLEIPQDVTVSSQVMAQPDPTLSSRVIARLSDGTPLVTRKRIDQGQVVLFHVTANAEWSNLPLSGLFVQMMERLSVSSITATPDPGDLEGSVWQPLRVIDAFGTISNAGTLPGVDGALLLGAPLGPNLHPGLYQSEDRSIARNVIGAETTLAATRWPADVAVEGLARPDERPLGGLLLALALLVLLADILASLSLSGRLRGSRATTAAIALVALLMPVPGAHAQGAASDDDFALAATAELVLAHVVTGNQQLDDLAQAGLQGLSDTLFFRTSVEPAAPMAVDIETDELSLFPFLYWPISATQPIPSDAAYAKLNRYLRTGGMILFDTRDADIAGFGAASPEGRRLQDIARPLDIPSLEPIPKDHVLTRTFYLLQDFPGRFAQGTIWVEAAPADAELIEGMPFRNLNDGVTPVVIGGNDWASAWAVDGNGNPLVPVGSGFAGERQREIALRFGVNLIMHVLTGNYKSDQVHVPALLDRLGQ
ncbi:DUF4159 domain-containing protein [Pseudooceanicola sediminis]|uniref:DUF4159 domain-containing protein n=1 Tax=Pseudooceanicola sediminis TaxID=2211117 RepID=A0A399JC11_9RHOB|nr:DUF4159 domain-containing protein [Pseudooceanicola sediminis]KAA2315645.1 DUF4159 domain-containing protein [Puniceibacterium sp. HSS470]RII40156.1 DUF4159 domain-containing protein [Pseudooceanicola sediminis]|tara:strand:- start:87467 stop:90256 length:2790 start_codon:yes stop_codon:yes gene_type:complete